MSEAVQLSKGPGLMRRISRGATSKLIRRRQSSNSVTNRDQSSGPVIMRRRSGAELDSDPALDGDDEDVSEETFPVYGLGLTNEAFSNGIPTSKKPTRTESGLAPIIPPLLSNGTTLTKVTKKKRKNLTFILDPESAKVSWNPSNPSKKFYIDDIQQIRLRGDARNYRQEFQVAEEYESLWFTIIYADKDRAKGRPVKTMHLMAHSQESFDLWTSTLDELSRYRHNLMKGLAGSGQDESTLQGEWKREMTKRFGERPRTSDVEKLDLVGVEALCRSLHINCSSNIIRAQFDKADSNKSGFLSFEEFKDFLRRLKERSDLKEIYKTLVANGQDGIDFDGFLRFLQNTQGVNISLNPAHWQKAFAKFVRKANPQSATVPTASDDSIVYMGFEAFCAFLFSNYNRVVSTKPSDVKLDRPLNEYFVSTSHNTYLLGRQVAGSSSTEAYIRALQRACRCVEIDCWDGPNGKPIVSHGRTMTTSVSFADCISVIAKYAFVQSPYPLILSLEVHCNPVQQQVMVDIMVKELGEWLATEPYMTNTFLLPSPEDLRNKILIKAKTGEEPLPEKDTGVDMPGRRQRSKSSPWSRPQILDNTFMSNEPMLSSPPSMSPMEFPSPVWGPVRCSTTATSMSSATDDSDTPQSGTIKPRPNPKKRRSKIIKPLADLAIYTRGIKYADFKMAESKTYNHIFSLAERDFERLCGDPEIESQLEKHNMRYLMRVYPSGFRLKSTNFDPLAFWRRGAQMVALNWQTYDLGMQMNDAMFAGGSDRTGYVLKPKELRQPSHFPESTPDPVTSKVQKQLIRFSVDLISAQQLPLPHSSTYEHGLDPYVEIEMYCAEDKGKGFATGEGGKDASARNGISGIGAPHRRRSAVVQSNGYNPVFNDKFKLSLETKYPDLVFIRWTVWNSPDGRNYNNIVSMDPLATFTAKLNSLEEGYRHLPLCDPNGDQFLFSTLFCKIMKEDPVTVERDDPVTEKLGRLRQLGQAVFKRTLSVEKKNPKDLPKRIPREISKNASMESSQDE